MGNAAGDRANEKRTNLSKDVNAVVKAVVGMDAVARGGCLREVGLQISVLGARVRVSERRELCEGLVLHRNLEES